MQRVVGSNIRKWRIEKQLTQEELAEYASIESRSVRAIEAGRRNVTIRTLEKIAKALEIPVYILLK